MAQTEKGEKKVNKINRKTFAIIACSVAVLCVLVGGAFGAYYSTLSYEDIFDGVTVCGESVGKMTVADAEMHIRDTFGDRFEDKTVSLVYGEHKKDIALNGMVRLDAKKTAENAHGVGREGNVFKKVWSYLFKNTADVELVLEVNESYINSEVIAFAGETESGHSIFEIDEEAGKVKIDLTDYDGAVSNIPKTAEKVMKNLSKLDFTDVELEMCNDFGSDFSKSLANRISRQPVDAAYRTVDGKAEIVEHINGVAVSAEDIDSHLKLDEKVFSVSATITEPELTTEKLKANAFSDVLGQETTRFNPNEIGRTVNVRLAANLINGTIIPSGQEFSFNRVVGKRTYERGFKNAGVYTNGELVDGVGGGICQVASTLYTAQLYADLKTVSRRNHMFTVAYSPLGQDATVAWGSVDYVFENDTPYPIKIECYTGNNTVTVKIIGTKVDKTKSVKIINNTISVRAFETKEELTEELPAGEEKVKQNGHDGVTVDSYKIRYENGVEVSREFLHRSTYIPMTKIVLKSSLEAEETPEGEEITDEETLTTPDTEDENSPETETQPPTETVTEPEVETDIELSDTGL